MVPRDEASGEVPYCLFRPGWAYVPNQQTTKMWYKRLDSDELDCMDKPGLCVQKGLEECEKNPSCGAISWWLGAMGRKSGLKNNGDAGSIFLVEGVTMENLKETARPHNHSNAMVKHEACTEKIGKESAGSADGRRCSICADSIGPTVCGAGTGTPPFSEFLGNCSRGVRGVLAFYSLQSDMLLSPWPS